MASAGTQPTPTKRYRATIVVVDDEENMGRILGKILEMEGYHVTKFTDPREAVEHISKTPPDLVLTDLKMPGMTGMEVLAEVMASNPSTSVIVMTAYGTIEGAIDAMRAGAFDYVTKPFKTDELLLTISKALHNTRLVEENETLSETLHRKGPDTELVGKSPALMKVISLIQRSGPTSSAVLIRGESGTGKELVARALHNSSPRSTKRFVAINCASIPESLLESELFGHEKGAFTGADRTKMGLVELAHNGTLFLDEIGDLPQPLQAKLLRVLQEREIQRVGALNTIQVDIRLIAASNRDLQAAMEAKEFRSDLFFRLNVINITVPPLRERTGDIPLLIDHFLTRSRRKLHRPNVTISPEALRALEEYRYPGNVRELENMVERMVVLCDNDSIELKDVPLDVTAVSGLISAAVGPSVPSANLDYKGAKDRFERDYLLKIIEAAGGNISEAARISGISRRHLYDKLEKLNVKLDK